MKPYLLHHLLAESAQRCPERDAVVLGPRAMTYGQLDILSDRVCSALLSMGVHTGDRVGIRLGKSIEAIVFLFGILKAGAAYVPIDPLAPQKRIEHIVRNCGIRFVFSGTDGVGDLLSVFGPDPSGCRIIVSGVGKEVPPAALGPSIIRADSLYAEAGEGLVLPDFSDANPAYILHTSGSTGMPKGVCLSHLNALTFINMAADYFGVQREDRLAAHAPLQFDLSVFDIFVAVSKGATIVLVPEHLSVFPMKLVQFIDETGISIWNSVASVLSMLAERGGLERYGFARVKTVIFSGDVLPVKHLRTLKIRMPKARFYNVYGQTEANSSMAYPVDEIPDDDAWKIPIGKSFPNFEVFALEENGRLVDGQGQIGELHVRSSSVAAGYWGDESKTSDCFVTDPRSSLSHRKVYKTGDLVTLDNNHDYFFLGRKDQQVKSRGYRIQLNEIETLLNNHPAVKEAVVIAIPDELIGNRIISHISLSDGYQVEEQALFRYCSGTLPAYMLPEKITFHAKLPQTPTGKIDRKSLEKQSRP